MYVEAAGLTLRTGIAGIVLSCILGLLCAAVQYEKVPVLRRIIGAYIELSRNTPLLVQLFFLYFGLPKLGIRISSEGCAVIGLTSGLESVNLIQWESSQSLGLTRRQTMRYVILPQAMATSVPPLCANVIFLIKETSIFSAIALADLMYVAKDLIGLYYKTTESLGMLVTSYLIILLPISIVASILERRLRYAGFGD